MFKLYSDAVEYNWISRLDKYSRAHHATLAYEACCNMMNHTLRIIYPRQGTQKEVELYRKLLNDSQKEFFKNSAFLFDILQFQGLYVDPVKSVFNAFLALTDSNEVDNFPNDMCDAYDGFWVWDEWHIFSHWNAHLHPLFMRKNCQKSNPNNDHNVIGNFYRAYEFLKLIHDIKNYKEETPSTSIMRIMPEIVKRSLVGSNEVNMFFPDNTYNIESDNIKSNDPTLIRPWLFISEGYVVYRKDIVTPLNITVKTLRKYEKNGETLYGTFWPSPKNSSVHNDVKYYNPQELLRALEELGCDRPRLKALSTLKLLMDKKLSTKLPLNNRT